MKRSIDSFEMKYDAGIDDVAMFQPEILTEENTYTQGYSEKSYYKNISDKLPSLQSDEFDKLKQKLNIYDSNNPINKLMKNHSRAYNICVLYNYFRNQLFYYRHFIDNALKQEQKETHKFNMIYITVWMLISIVIIAYSTINSSIAYIFVAFAFQGICAYIIHEYNIRRANRLERLIETLVVDTYVYDQSDYTNIKPVLNIDIFIADRMKNNMLQYVENHMHSQEQSTRENLYKAQVYWATLYDLYIYNKNYVEQDRTEISDQFESFAEKEVNRMDKF